MQKLALKDFELRINAATWLAAENLLQAGAVKNLREVEKHFWVALVETEEGGVVETEIIITPSKVKAYTCECFTEGRRLMCAHVAASLVRIRQYLDQRTEARKEKVESAISQERTRFTVQSALETATMETLSAFVKSYARKDRNFALALKTWFAGASEEPGNSYRLVLDSVIPKQAAQKGLRDVEFRRLRTTLDDLAVQLENAVLHHHARNVFLIGSAVLDIVPPLRAQMEEQRRATLDKYCQEALEELLKLDDATASRELREEIRHFVLQKAASGSLPRGMEREVLRYLAASAKEQELFETIRQLYDETPYPAPPFVLHLFLAALSSRKMPEAALRVLDDYQASPERIRDAIVELYYLQQYESVALATDKYLSINLFGVRYKREMEQIQLYVAEKTGEWGKVAAALRRQFLQNGEADLLQQLSKIKGDKWPEERAILIAEIKKTGDQMRLANLYAAEKMTQELLQILENEQDILVFQRFEAPLFETEPAFVRQKYLKLLEDYLTDHFGTPAAKQVRLWLAELKNKGAGELVKEICKGLTDKFPDRSGLAEELSELYLLRPPKLFFVHES